MKNRRLALAGLMLALTLASAPQGKALPSAGFYLVVPSANTAAVDDTPAPDLWAALLSVIGSIL
jgi:hypothetical protein